MFNKELIPLPQACLRPAGGASTFGVEVSVDLFPTRGHGKGEYINDVTNVNLSI